MLPSSLTFSLRIRREHLHGPYPLCSSWLRASCASYCIHGLEHPLIFTSCLPDRHPRAYQRHHPLWPRGCCRSLFCSLLFAYAESIPTSCMASHLFVVVVVVVVHFSISHTPRLHSHARLLHVRCGRYGCHSPSNLCFAQNASGFMCQLWPISDIQIGATSISDGGYDMFVTIHSSNTDHSFCSQCS